MHDSVKLKNNGKKFENMLKVHLDISAEGIAQIRAKIRYLKLKKLSFNFLLSISKFKKLAPPKHIIIP